MGAIRLNVQAGAVSEQVELSTPFDDASKDEGILSALRKVAEIKDRGHKGEIETLKAEHETELASVRDGIEKLKSLIVADIVLARTQERAGLDATKETAYYMGLSVERLLIEADHYTGETPAAKTTSDSPQTLAVATDDAI